MKEFVERRKEPRLQTTLAVRVSGIDVDGNDFNKLVTVYDVSKRGARLQGLGTRVFLGSILTVQYNRMRADFKVARISTGPNQKQAEIGLQLLPSEPVIWQTHLNRLATAAKEASVEI